MKLKFKLRILTILLVSMLSAPAFLSGQIIFEDGGENIVNTALSDFIIVRDNLDEMPTTVLMQDGAVIPFNTPIDTQSILVEGNSVVLITGGMTTGHLNTFGTSTATFLGGVIGDEIEAFGDSVITIGSPDATAAVLDIEDDLQVAENGLVEMFDGRVFDDVETGGTSTLNIFDGEFDEDIEAFDNSTINIFGGIFSTGFSDALDTEGGEIAVEDDESPNSATINVHGGTFIGAKGDPDFCAESNGIINIFGSDFAVDGVPVPFGPIEAEEGQLTGTLEDGSALDNDFAIFDNAQIILVEVGAGVLGDVNCDGEVNLLDVAPFVDLITNGGFSVKADINGDGNVDLLDVAPFVQLILGGG